MIFMRAPPSWLLPAVVAVVIVVAAISQLRRPEPTSHPRPARNDVNSQPPAERTPARTHVNASTPEKTSGPKATQQGPPSPEKTIEEWRTIILRRDRGSWDAMQTVLRRDWATYREHVIRLAGSDENDRVRAVNLRLLGAQKDPELIPFFAERLEKDPSDFAQENCCWALGELAAKDHADLVRRFVADESTSVAAAAREALRRMSEGD